MSGKNKEADAGQMQAAQTDQGLSRALAGLMDYGVGVSKSQLAMGQQLQQPLIDYNKALTSGNMPAVISALGPQLGNIATQTKQAESNIYNRVAPGAGRDYALAQNQMGQGQQNAGLINNAFTQGLTGNANIGSQDLAQALQYLGAGIGSGSQATSASTQSGQIYGQLSDQAAQRKASTMGFLGSLAGAAGTAAGGGAFGKPSDRRLKENIFPIGTVGGIEWYQYNFIGDPKPEIGVMAQEVYEKYPEFVIVGGPDPDTKPWMVKYGPLIAKLTEVNNG